MARFFDGVDDLINLGTTSVLNPPAITVSAWVNMRSLTPAYSTIYTRNNAPSTVFHAMHITSAGKMAIYLFTGVSIFYDGTGLNTLVKNTWYHIAFSYSAGEGLKGYVNGLIDGTVAGNGTITAGANIATAVGTDLINAGRYTNGVIDDVRVWNRVLSLAEIRSMYRSRGNIHFPNGNLLRLPVLGNGSAEQDFSRFKNNGVVTGAIKAPPHPGFTFR